MDICSHCGVHVSNMSSLDDLITFCSNSTRYMQLHCLLADLDEKNLSSLLTRILKEDIWKVQHQEAIRKEFLFA